jgi:DNA-binding beta-propeller fold protein YncE
MAGAGPTAPLPAWPPPPAQPDIVYVRQIAGPRDIGARPAFFTRLANALTGESAQSQGFARPFGLSLDEAGNLTVTDTGARAVCYLDFKNKKWTRWIKAGERTFLSPVAAVHHGATFYVADSGLARVIAFDVKGHVQFEITNELARPAGLAICVDRLAVADSERQQVAIFGLDGRLISKFGARGRGPGEFNYPTHLAVDASQRMYVTDSLNSRVQVFTPDGQFIREFGSAGDGPGHFGRPKGVAVDANGHVYVVDAVFNNVQIFNEQGRLLLDFGTGGSDAGQFWLPNGLAISPENEIFVSDAYNHRVQEFRYTGRE